MFFCCFSLIVSEIFQLANRHRYQLVGKVTTDISSTREIICPETLVIPKRMKNAVLISIALEIEILIRNENIASKEHKTKQLLSRNNLSCIVSYKP